MQLEKRALLSLCFTQVGGNDNPAKNPFCISCILCAAWA